MKPIQFNTEMVKAILEGRKNQTRRIVANKILNEIHKNDCYIQNGQIYGTCMCQGDPDGSGGYEVDRWEEIYTQSYSQYKVGDILYVRETFNTFSNITMDNEVGVIYKADNKEVILPCNRDYECEYVFNDKWKPSIHMPKKYARIFLKVTNVGVERLQDISVRDIEKVTGWKREIYSYSNKNKAFFKDYRDFWNSTAKDGYKWEDNPYVFVYELERIHDV